MFSYNLRKRSDVIVKKMGKSNVKRMRPSNPSFSSKTISEQPNEKICAIQKLPSEILVKIFEQLDVSTRMSIEGVCQRWKTIGCAYSWNKTAKLVVRDLLHTFIREPYHRSWEYKRRCRKYMKDVGNRQLSSLMLRCAERVTNLDLSNLEEYINFANCWHIMLHKIPSNHLRHLDISGIEIDPAQLELLGAHFTSLKSAVFKECFRSPTSIDVFLSLVTQLETLDLSENDIHGTTFRELPSSLKNLSLNYCRGVTDFMLAQIPLRCPGLKCFQVCDTDQDRNIYSQTLNAVFQLENLQKLIIKGDFCVQINQPFHMPQLSHLEITFDEFLSDTFLYSVGQCSQLKTLFLFDTAPDQELHYAHSELLQLANLKQLDSLSLVGFWNLSDDTMKTIAESNPGLKALDVSFSLLTDESMMFVVGHCNQLQSLVVANCGRVSLKTVQKIVSCLHTVHGDNLPEKSDYIFQMCCCNTGIREESLVEASNPWLNVRHYNSLDSQCMSCYFFPLQRGI